jgi:hypothetical protein
MAQFTTRVELHDATWSDYEQLHANMRGQGFTQTIRSDDGCIYELPPAEYDYQGPITRAQVLDKAKSAASAVKPSYGVLVTESAGRTWYGLRLLKKAAA